ncbi:MAG: hypothetical protein SFY69_13470 [Planctomycetota bacterium]|nr:hypothetical protein [Planctomycetota bacterium]
MTRAPAPHPADGARNASTPAPNAGAPLAGARIAEWTRIAGYAAFLACSWTWCIGMYLPVILRRDFGPWAFAIFAIPNCLGAAAMGVMLWRRGSSERLLSRHALAARVFSLVTLIFQVWFFVSLLRWASVDRLYLAGGVGLGVVAGLLAVGGKPSLRRAASAILWSVSLVLVLSWLNAPAPARPPAPLPAPTEGVLDLLVLAPISLFGFALSPYLDLTFHAARQSLPGRAGTQAFLYGFLLLFPCMLALTWAYTPALLGADPVHPERGLPALVGAHIGAQLAFTAVLHLRSAAAGPPPAGAAIAWGAVALAVVLALAGFLVPAGWTYSKLSLFELVYRVFMGFYSLVAPAYVLLAVVGGGVMRPAPDKRTWLVFAGAIAIASPLFWMGFVERETPYLLVGLGVVLLAKAFIRRAESPQADRARPARSA